MLWHLNLSCFVDFKWLHNYWNQCFSESTRGTNIITLSLSLYPLCCTPTRSHTHTRTHRKPTISLFFVGETGHPDAKKLGAELEKNPQNRSLGGFSEVARHSSNLFEFYNLSDGRRWRDRREREREKKIWILSPKASRLSCLGGFEVCLLYVFI